MDKVTFFTIDENQLGQRIDNFLITKLKGVPKSLVYRIIRKGEIRVNKGRIKPEYKLQLNDVIRIPPIKISQQLETKTSVKLNKIQDLSKQILFEDDTLLIINKPSGIAVHGGSGLSFGVIEAMRALKSENKFLELIHRIDRDTSGILMIAKKRSTLKFMHEQLRLKQVKKEYLALVKGAWHSKTKFINAPLVKNELKSGERVVIVGSLGKPSETKFSVEERYSDIATLIKASPITGRTHQIRVHCQYNNHPIAMDDKYGDSLFDQIMQKLDLKRLFLHAYSITFIHPKSEQSVRIEAPLDQNLKAVLCKLRQKANMLDVTCTL